MDKKVILLETCKIYLKKSAQGSYCIIRKYLELKGPSKSNTWDLMVINKILDELNL